MKAVKVVVARRVVCSAYRARVQRIRWWVGQRSRHIEHQTITATRHHHCSGWRRFGVGIKGRACVCSSAEGVWRV